MTLIYQRQKLQNYWNCTHQRYLATSKPCVANISVVSVPIKVVFGKSLLYK